MAGTIVIIQARMASARLPGKSLMKLDGKPLIEHTIRQTAKARNVSKIILATSINKDNDPLEALCKKIGVECFRGSEDDVLERFIEAAKKHNPELIVRICGDEPLLDIRILEEAIEKHKAEGADYSTTVGAVPKGLDVEVVNYEVLKKVHEEANAPVFREHVTNYILKNPQKFRILRLDFGKELARPDIVLTVDTQEDFDFVKKLYFELKKRKILSLDSLAREIIRIVDSGIMKRKPILLLRADGSAEKGFGDIISLMNIAEALKDDYEMIFASQDFAEAVDFIKKKGYECFVLPRGRGMLEETRMIKAFCSGRKIKKCIVQLMPQNEAYVRELSSFLKALAVDFFGKAKIHSDILLNWDMFATGIDYSYQDKDVLRLLGPDYLPLSKELVSLRKKSYSAKLQHIIVTFGGSDPRDLSIKILDSVRKLANKYDFLFILGPGFRKKQEFEKKSKGLKIRIEVAPANIHKLFSQADLVICSGGLTAFEMCAMGVPFIGTSMIEWEDKRLRKLGELGVCKYVPADKLNEKLLLSIQELEEKHKRTQLASAGIRLIDGKGSQRIAEEIRKKWKR